MFLNPLILAARILDGVFPKDDNPEHWGTVNGARVHYNSQGEIDGGAGGKLNSNRSLLSPLQKAANIIESKPAKRKVPRITPAERERVTHEISTWFHGRFDGKDEGSIAVRNYLYFFHINEYGDYDIYAKFPLK